MKTKRNQTNDENGKEIRNDFIIMKLLINSIVSWLNHEDLQHPLYESFGSFNWVLPNQELTCLQSDSNRWQVCGKL